MKTLYGILGVSPTSSAEQIETAYANFASMLKNGANGLSDEEIRLQTVAAKDAYNILSNPILRQRYDQKLAETVFAKTAAYEFQSASQETSSGLSLKAIALFGAFALAGLYFYTQNVKERERLRVQHEHEVQMKAIQIAEEQQKQNAKVQDVILERSSSQADDRQLRLQQQEFERDSLRTQQLDLQRQRLELQQQQQLKREEESRLRQEDSRKRQEQLQRQQQLQKEKRLLQQLELNHYGKVITH